LKKPPEKVQILKLKKCDLANFLHLKMIFNFHIFGEHFVTRQVCIFPMSIKELDFFYNLYNLFQEKSSPLRRIFCQFFDKKTDYRKKPHSKYKKRIL
jgi:hypothetical protein